ncbi:MAG: YdcF family protein [Myxococcota bacterium]
MRLRRGWRNIALGVGLCALGAATVFLWALWVTDAPALTDRFDPRAGADLVLVPGGDAGPRTETGSALVLRGIPRILFSGAGVGGDNARVLAAQALALGVSPAAIETEDRATTTEENMLFSRPILERLGVHRVVIVTGSAHAVRALCAARRAWPAAIEVRVAIAEAEGRPLRLRLREALKYLRYRLTGRC